MTHQVVVKEWESLSPEIGTPLRGVHLESSREVQRLSRELAAEGKIEILDLLHGLEVRASSYVGRVTVGTIQITIEPKIAGAPLARLLRYAYGLRNLQLYAEAEYATASRAFQDILVNQYLAEVKELISRGLHRDYRRAAELLHSPMGRIDLERLAMAAGRAEAALPCVHYPRLDGTLLNRVLLAGLHLACRLARDMDLRAALRKHARIMEMSIEPIVLSREVLGKGWRECDRRTVSYRPALKLVGLLLEGQGTNLGAGSASIAAAGFLFDMNRFFQSLLERFLREHLVEFTVRGESPIKHLFRYELDSNPRNRRTPQPRPDFVIQGTAERRYYPGREVPRSLGERATQRHALSADVVCVESKRSREASGNPVSDPRPTRVRPEDRIPGPRQRENMRIRDPAAGRSSQARWSPSKAQRPQDTT